MSSDFYFKKWKKILVKLEATVNLDIHYQETKAHDKKRCKATQRLSGVLGLYLACYNDIWECLHQNLQVQKTKYIRDVMKAVISRILELKHEVRKLEKSEFHFNSDSLAYHKLTPNDVELVEIPDKMERSKEIRNMLEDFFKQDKERKLRLEEEAAKDNAPEIVKLDWWDVDYLEETHDSDEDKDTEKIEISEEQQEVNSMVKLIQAQERSRQIVVKLTKQRNQRDKWEKEFYGTLAPPAPYDIRERAAKLIQSVCRFYFELKRNKQMQYKRDDLLGIRLCSKKNMENKAKSEQVKVIRTQLKKKYDEEWIIEYKTLKQEYLKKKGDEIKEDCRDHIRDWFRLWYEDIQFFHDVPEKKQGGAALIFKEELPTPEKWLEEYHNYLAEKAANKNKTNYDKKFAKLDAKREEMERKRQEHIKSKMEQELRRKMMKNPTLHPGFNYPKSKMTHHILEVIENYNRDWAELDETETLEVKEKYVRVVNMSNVYMETNLEMITSVAKDMSNELKLLKAALKKDYENKGEKMPKPMKPKKKKGKKKTKKMAITNIAEKLEDLVLNGYITEYPKTKLEEFIGDPNFSGDDKRCDYVAALPYNGEIRSMWWEKCHELSHKCHKILLVGPRGSGKTRLVHILATMNDAVLFDLDPKVILRTLPTEADLNNLVRSVASSAKTVQPSVIHIKHVHRFHYRKVPPEDANVDWKIAQRYFMKKLFKQIQKYDKVTIIATCVDPWMVKSKPLLKKFPTVILLPNTSYGTAVQILNEWVLSYAVIPPDFDVSCLAHVLQGYSYGYLKNVLNKFMSADTIARISVHGFSPMDVYNFIIQDGTGDKIDYEKYIKWYSDNTTWGKLEQRHLEEQREFKQAMADFLQRMEKKKLQTKHDKLKKDTKDSEN